QETHLMQDNFARRRLSLAGLDAVEKRPCHRLHFPVTSGGWWHEKTKEDVGIDEDHSSSPRCRGQPSFASCSNASLIILSGSSSPGMFGRMPSNSSMV